MPAFSTTRWIGWARDPSDGHFQQYVKGTDYLDVLTRLEAVEIPEPVRLRVPCERVVLRAGERPETRSTIQKGECLECRQLAPYDEWELALMDEEAA